MKKGFRLGENISIEPYRIGDHSTVHYDKTIAYN